jgi:glyoxylase-like metal-dependent hydrolase (beta-lactamase superfamily II)
VNIGEIEILAVNDGEGKLPSSYIPKLDWERHGSLLDADGNFAIALGCFLIRTKDHTILVDAGLGPVTFPPFRGGDLPGALSAAGVAPDDVDLVCVTHLHVDHIGWLAQDGKPFFPRATVRFGEKDLDQFMRGDEPDAMSAPIINVLEAAGRIDTLHGDASVAPGVDMIDTPGHTLGHMSVVVSSGTQRAFVLGDAIACPAQLEDSEWAAMSDIDPDLSSRSREALYRELEGSDDVMVAAHFPDLEFGRVLRGEGKRYFS